MSVSEERLNARMAAMKIRPDDIEEIFTRSGGPGGQNVNKTSSAVVLVYRPTGLQVRCEQERSQSQNRWRARELLLDKLAAQRRAELQAQRSRIERARRQNRKRSRAAQERILRDKSHRSATKRLRRTNHDD